MSQPDSTQFTFLGIAGPLLCVKCGLPFAKGERVVYVCRGEHERLTLDAIGAEGDDVLCDADSASMRKMTMFDLCHESCP